MSSAAMSDVLTYSPYRGATHWVLFSIADSVGEDDLFYLTQTRLADKARVTTKAVQAAIKRLVADGWLEEVQASDHGVPGIFRLRSHVNRPVVYE